MYIPTMFFGGQTDCIECLFSGSIIPDGVTFDKLNSDWAYIKIPAGKEVAFQTKTGVSTNAKMLVVGGGGHSYNASGVAGGGGAGKVIFQDFGIQPDILYYASASIGGRLATPNGQSSIFIENYSVDPVNWTIHTATGGDDNNGTTGGNSGNGYSGGIGCGTGTSAGGGAGSMGNGGDATCGGSEIGGNGGDGYTIPAPFDSVVLTSGTKIAGGGPGESNFTDGTWASGVAPGAYGNGGTNSADENGRDGVVFIFLPITNCETGSREGLDFIAEGGTTGTFYSGSVQYKYHVFTQGSSSLGGTNTFNVIQGVTDEAKTFVVGGGAGSSTKKWTTSNGVSDFCIHSGGGAGAGGVKINENVTLWGYSNQIITGEGGPKYSNGYRSTLTQFPSFSDIFADGGGRGSYFADGTYTPNTGNANNGGSGGGGYYFVDNTGGTSTGNGIGNSGGDGYSGGTTLSRYAGGGGGGAGSAGSNATSTFGTVSWAPGGSGYDLAGTFWSFLTGSVYTSRSDIAIGGSGSAGMYSYGTSPYSCGAVPAGGANGSQQNDGSGADPVDNASGNDGIIVIAYPISGSISNS